MKEPKRTKKVCLDEYARKLENFSDYASFKATELRQLLLVLGITVFKDIFPPNAYMHFLFLHVAIRCLCYYVDSYVHLQFTDLALRTFVSRTEEIYIHAFVFYNIHGLLNLVKDVRRFGALDFFSASPYENFLWKFSVRR